MSLKADLYALLAPLVSNRCYPLTFVQPNGSLPVWPAIRYTPAGGDPTQDICGSGDADGDTVRMQLDLVAATNADLSALLTSVRTALRDATVFDATLQGSPEETWDPDTKTHRAILFYEFDNHGG
jgi:hypothetical protein